MNESKEKMELHYCGHRFNNHKLPLSLFSDLAKLNSLVTNLAADLYLDDHPDRIRVPKGFKSKVQLSLAEIKDGSVAISLLPSHSDNQTNLLPTEEDNYLFRGFGLIIDEMADASLSQLDPKYRQPIHSFLSTFGSDLRDDEMIEFMGPGDKKSSFNLDYRRSLISQEKEYDEHIEFYGIITEADAKNKTFTISQQTDDGTRNIAVSGVTGEVLSNAVSVLKCYGSGRRVFISGTGHYKRGTLSSITKVDDLILLDYNDVQSRMDELSFLKDGWGMNGDGKSLPRDRLRILSQLFDDFYWSDTVLPYIYPTIDGNLEFEWTIEEKDFILSVNLSDFNCELVTPETEMEFSLDDKEGWDFLNRTLREASDVN